MNARVDRSSAAATPQLITRLRRVEGQVRGIASMLERGDEPLEVQTQIAAARAALAAVSVQLIDHEVHDALTAAGVPGERAEQTGRALQHLLACHGIEGAR